MRELYNYPIYEADSRVRKYKTMNFPGKKFVEHPSVKGLWRELNKLANAIRLELNMPIRKDECSINGPISGPMYRKFEQFAKVQGAKYADEFYSEYSPLNDTVRLAIAYDWLQTPDGKKYAIANGLGYIVPDAKPIVYSFKMPDGKVRQIIVYKNGDEYNQISYTQYIHGKSRWHEEKEFGLTPYEMDNELIQVYGSDFKKYVTFENSTFDKLFKAYAITD